MAPKKKPAAGAGDDGNYWEEFKLKFRNSIKHFNNSVKESASKRPEGQKSEEIDKNSMRDIEAIMENIETNQEPQSFWSFTDENLDLMVYRLLMQALATCQPAPNKDAEGEKIEPKKGYNKIKALRLWKCCCDGDEIVRCTCFYLDSQCQKEERTAQNCLEELQFVDCNVTALGCSFLGKSLRENPNILCLRLDFNQFGSAGMEQLAAGLAQNFALQKLDLNYCGIDASGGRFIFEILIYTKSALESLEIRGNDLGNEGILEVIHGAKRAKKLKVLGLSDNKFGEEVGKDGKMEVIDKFVELFHANTSIEKYDLMGNYITDVGARELIQKGFMGSQTYIKEVMLPETCSPAIINAGMEMLEGGKKGAGKKKKKGRK